MTVGNVMAGRAGQDLRLPATFSAQARLRALQSGIMDLILERGLDAGDPLPTEHELSAALGVGRNTLRESLKVLQALGVIEIRHGFGMFVAPTNLDALADGLMFRGRLSLRHQGQEALQLVEVRQSLESGLIGASLELMTPEQLAAAGECVRRMESLARAGEHFVEADAEFHRLLFEPLNNALLTSLMGVFWKVYRRIHVELGAAEAAAAAADAAAGAAAGARAGGGRAGDGSADGADLLADAAIHRGIYEAVAAGDQALAAQRLRAHFDGLRHRIQAAVGE